MTQILKILDVDDGKWKQDFGVFNFWELSFNGIFVKLSKEWGPPYDLSHHITSLLSLSKNQFGILTPTRSSLCLFSFFFFFYLELSLLTGLSLLVHKPPPPHQSSPSWATTRLGLCFFLSLFPPFARSISLSSIFSLSLSHPFCQIVTIMSNQHKPPWDQFKLNPDWFIFVSNFVIWVSDLRILSLGLLCLWFGFAMHSFGFFVWHQRERERARPDLHVGEENKGFEKRCWTEPKWDREIRGPRDRKLHRQHQLVLCIRRRSNSQSSKRHCFIVSSRIFRWCSHVSRATSIITTSTHSSR